MELKSEDNKITPGMPVSTIEENTTEVRKLREAINMQNGLIKTIFIFVLMIIIVGVIVLIVKTPAISKFVNTFISYMQWRLLG